MFCEKQKYFCKAHHPRCWTGFWIGLCQSWEKTHRKKFRKFQIKRPSLRSFFAKLVSLRSLHLLYLIWSDFGSLLRHFPRFSEQILFVKALNRGFFQVRLNNPTQRYKMESFAEIVFSSILVVWQCSEFSSAPSLQNVKPPESIIITLNCLTFFKIKNLIFLPSDAYKSVVYVKKCINIVTRLCRSKQE